MRLLAAAALVMAVQASAPQGTGTLQGTVVSTAGSTPVANASVVIARVGGALIDYRAVLTDSGGRFAVRDLVAGSYRIYAERDGFLRGEHGSRFSGTAGTPVSVIDGQVTASIGISLTPTGAIAGRVTDGSRAAPLVWIRALKPSFFDGQKSFSIAAWAQTDDRGEFRLFGLAPGFYYVSAILPRSSWLDGDNLISPAVPTRANNNVSQTSVPATVDNLDPRAFERLAAPAVYHPGTTDIERAVAVEVRAGESVAGLALALVHVEPRTVRGRVTAPDASALASLRITLTPTLSATNAPIPSPQIKDGAFELSGVPPGRYLVTVYSPAANAVRFVGSTTVDLTITDVNDVTVALNAGGTVTGKLSIDGRPAAETDGAILVQLQSAAPGTPGLSAQRVQPDGSFTIANVFPGRYRFRVLQAGKAPWVKSARWGVDDVVTAPIVIEGNPGGRSLDIDLSTKTAVIDAQVVDSERRPLAGVLVIAVPDAPRRNRSTNFRSASTDAQGRVRLQELAPGEYRLFATTDIPATDWQDPDLLRKYESRGEIVRIGESGSGAVTLRVLR